MTTTRMPMAPKAGQRITAKFLRDMSRAMVREVRGGAGVTTSNLNGMTTISVPEPNIPGTQGRYASAPTLGAGTEGSETADLTTWDRDDQADGEFGFDEWYVSRVVYNDAGDEVLYAFLRLRTFDARGMLRTVSGETRVTVDVPGICT